MQPLGANWDLVADASCQEEEDEERQFGWLSRATVKWHQSRIIRSRAPPSAAVATGKRGCQEWLGGGIGLSWWVKRLVWVAGQVRGGVQELAALRDALPSQWEGTELVCVWVNKGLDARVEEKYWDGRVGGVAVSIQPQNMVVSYLVLTGRLLESRWSKSQVLLPRECMSPSISRGSICRGGGREGGGTRGGRETVAAEAIVPHWQFLSWHTRMWIGATLQWSYHNHRHLGLNPPQHGWCPSQQQSDKATPPHTHTRTHTQHTCTPWAQKDTDSFQRWRLVYRLIQTPALEHTCSTMIWISIISCSIYYKMRRGTEPIQKTQLQPS